MMDTTRPEASLKIRRTAVALGSIFFCWSLFLILMRYVWPYEGIAMMETATGSASYGLIHQIPGIRISFLNIRLLGWSIPAMSFITHGPWGIYFLTPFIALGGCTLTALRSYSSFMFFFALWGTWQLALLLRKDRLTAFLSILVVAVCPTMVTTRSMFVTAPDVAACVWTLCFAILFARTRKKIYAYAACCAFFAGLCTRTWVAGLGVGLLIFIVLTWRQVLSLLPKSRGTRALLIVGCLACAGIFLAPIIAFNADSGWSTIKFFSHHLINRAQWACPPHAICSNLNFWPNFKLSFAQLEMLWDGDLSSIRSGAPWHWLYFPLLLLSLAHTAREVWRRRTLWSVSAMLWIVTIGYFLSSIISPTSQSTINLAPLAPILSVMMFSWVDAVPQGAGRKAALLVLALLPAVQFAGDFYLLRRANIDLAEAGHYEESPLLIETCQWAGWNPRTPIISLSAPFTWAATYFSPDRARFFWWPALDPSYHIPWKQWLLRKDRPYFLVERDGVEPPSYLGDLRAEAAKLKLPLTRIKVFRDSLGRPAFEIYRVQ